MPNETATSPGGASRALETARTLANALWFPVLFAAGFMFCYLLPFHSPAPHDLPVAVQGEEAAAAVSVALEDASPGGFDVVPTDDPERVVLDRDAVAAYDPAHHELYVAGSLGAALEQTAVSTFTPVAAQDSSGLEVTDAAPSAPGDGMGMSLFYLVLTWTLTGYISVIMLAAHAPHLRRRAKVLTVAGFGAFTSVFCYTVADVIDAIPHDLSVIPIAFLLTQAVSWTCLGLAPFVTKWLPGVAMTVFVLLSMPSSGGAIPLPMVPEFFQNLHPVLPMGRAIDAIRAVLYFDGAGLWPAVAVLGGWLALGALLLAAATVRERSRRRAPGAHAGGAARAASEEADDAAGSGPGTDASPSLIGRVTDTSGRPVAGAVVSVVDHAGRHVAALESGTDGAYSGMGLPGDRLTLLASAPGHSPRVARVTLDHGGLVHLDFALYPDDAAVRAPESGVSEGFLPVSGRRVPLGRRVREMDGGGSA
ncbi:carboxypeptidase regulatory-like domain-containing protein [Nocardiopsis chromatogenes]|uniref:carboxypeptidase regulatory-like domain-containing protein n=1 Tax=Nocardiopsis chromatogenes TaxID=280239 RepID=UPI000346046D|nr:carboxypeptidase regulatory-like domain-containing protein [Nocardiopsis chromatogenes]